MSTDLLTNTLDAIQQQPDKNVNFWETELTQLVDLHAKNIPSLNVTPLRDLPQQSVVHFRGMIRDQKSVQYIVQVVSRPNPAGNTTQSALYREDMEVSQDDIQREGNLVELHPFIVCRVPHESQWQRNFYPCRPAEEEAHLHVQPDLAQDLTVRIYTNGKTIRVCDVLDMYGILSSNLNQDEAKQVEEDEEIPPSLHVICWNKVDRFHPSIVQSDQTPEYSELLNEFRERHADIRRDILSYISSHIEGDELMAQYIFYHILSRVVSRTKSVVLGAFSLCLTGLPRDNTDFCQSVINVYESLCPNVVNLDLECSTLNHTKWAPWKNYDTDAIEPGCLQFPSSGSHIIANQTILTEGKLEEVGIKNLRSLKQIMETQKLAYDFTYYTVDFDTNAPVVVLAHGKPLIECDVTVKFVRPSNPVNDLVMPDEETLDLWRRYICIARDFVQLFGIDGKIVEDDWVNLRRQETTASSETLHHRLNLCRLIKSSLLLEEVSLTHMEEMQMLEDTRKSRMS